MNIMISHQANPNIGFEGKVRGRLAPGVSLPPSPHLHILVPELIYEDADRVEGVISASSAILLPN